MPAAGAEARLGGRVLERGDRGRDVRELQRTLTYVVVRAREDHVFMHLDAPPEVRRGQAIAAGRRLGVVGDTGHATACHLHFEIWTAPGWYEGGAPRDPRPDLRTWAGS